MEVTIYCLSKVQLPKKIVIKFKCVYLKTCIEL